MRRVRISRVASEPEPQGQEPAPAAETQPEVAPPYEPDIALIDYQKRDGSDGRSIETR